MAILKCKMCGGNLEVTEGMTVCECEYCGSKQTVPSADDEKKIKLFDRANRLRMACEFDKSAGVYESIVSEFDTEAEAYWGLVLCKYGIEYVDDPATGDKIPTCHRSSFESVMEDADFELVMENSDNLSRNVYREQAKQIEDIRKRIIDISGKETPYDIFVCYKETDENGDRTVDSVLAQDVYDELVSKGYKVFFSRITLEDKLGQEYEPYIFAALNSAKVMLAFGTSYDYYNAVWVKNEWSRFLKLMANDKEKTLIPCYKDIDAYDIPSEFKHLQAQDMGKVGATQDLLRGIDKIFGNNQETNGKSKNDLSESDVKMNASLKRGWLALEEKDWDTADMQFERALGFNAELAMAYLGKVCVDLRVQKYEEIVQNDMYNENNNFKKFLRFANESELEVKEKIDKLNDEKKLLDKKRKEERIDKLPYLKMKRKEIEKYKGRLFTICSAIVGIKSDGSVIIAGENEYSQSDVSEWNDIIDIDADYDNIVGIKGDGRVIAVGKNREGECSVEDWESIIDVALVRYNVGLKSDGSVITAGRDYAGECKVGKWENITQIAIGCDFTLGLKSDGTVVATGENGCNQCDVEDWENIVKIYAADGLSVGLTRDGRVVATGSNEDGQCNVNDWKDIVIVSTAYDHVVGLKSDGRVVAVGDNQYGQCDVEDWENVIDIAVSYGITMGLKSDGRVIAVGDNECGRCDINGWGNIIAIAVDTDYAVGLKKDGSIVVAGETDSINVDDIKLFEQEECIEEYELGEDERQYYRQKMEYRKKKMIERQEETRVEQQRIRNEQLEKLKEQQRIREEQEKIHREQERIREEEKRKEQKIINEKRKEELEHERFALQRELSNLGFFSGKRKKEIEMQLMIINDQINKL